MATKHDGSHSIEAEFGQLQREYRNMEQNRKAYTEESQNILRKQQETIRKLRKDEEALKAELAMETRHAASKGLGSGPTSKLATLQDQGDAYTQRLAVETRNLEELNKAISVMKSKILQQRRKMGGVNAAKENHKMVQKQIRILENRLDKALVKFNEALAHNKRLRASIDSLRRERVVFDNIYRKLEKELHEKKKQMANIIEMSNQAYETRDQSQLEITAYEQLNSKEQQEFEEELAELDRLIEEDRRKKEMMIREQNREHINQRGDMSKEEEEELKRKVTKGVWGIAKDKATVQVAELKVQSYEEAFNKIKAATGITDIDRLVSTFIENEEQNFSLFNFVNEQNNELEKLEEQIQQLREEEVKYTQESGEDIHQHKQLLSDLEKKLQLTESSAEKYEKKYQEALRTVNALKTGIQNIFVKAGCEKSALAELLSDAVVTEANIMQFLGIIEQRTNEILQMWAATNSGKSVDGDDQSSTAMVQTNTPSAEQAKAHSAALLSILGQGPTTPMGKEAVQINPPNLEDYSSDEESDNSESESRPLTHAELKVKTMKQIHKHAVTGSKDVKVHRGGKRRQHTQDH